MIIRRRQRYLPPQPHQIYQPTVPTADQKVVCIVFDDDWKSQLEALPILQRYGYKTTFAIVTGYAGYPEYMSWKDIRHLASMGMEIASHTHTHIDLGKASAKALHDELSKNRAILRSRGMPPTCLFTPIAKAAKTTPYRRQ